MKPHLSFAITCESAIQGENGKYSLINIFTYVAAIHGFPVTYKNFMVATTVKALIGDHTQRIQIVNERTGIIIASSETRINIKNEDGATLVVDFSNTAFPEPGKYFLQIFLDGISISSENNFITVKGG